MTENPLGGLLGGLLGGGQDGGKGGGLAALIPGILAMLQGGGQGGSGGLSGLVGQLQSSGLGDQVQSWLGGGDNKKVAPEALEQAVGSDTVDKLAAQAGMTHDQARDGLAQVLPQVVDKLSPNGQLPSAGNLNDMLGGLLGGGTK